MSSIIRKMILLLIYIYSKIDFKKFIILSLEDKFHKFYFLKIVAIFKYSQYFYLNFLSKVFYQISFVLEIQIHNVKQTV